MGIYSSRINENVIEEELNIDEQTLVDATCEAALYEDLQMMTEEQRSMFLNSDEYKALQEAGLTSAIGKNTIVKLNKTDDLERRIGQASLNIAREKNDALWIKLMKNRRQEKKLLHAIKKKYSSPAERVAKKAQKQYVKTHKIAIGFMRK